MESVDAVPTGNDKRCAVKKLERREREVGYNLHNKKKKEVGSGSVSTAVRPDEKNFLWNF